MADCVFWLGYKVPINAFDEKVTCPLSLFFGYSSYAFIALCAQWFTLSVLGFGFWVQGFGFGGSGFWVPSFGFWVSGFVFRVSGSEFRVQGSRVSGLIKIDHYDN